MTLRHLTSALIMAGITAAQPPLLIPDNSSLESKSTSEYGNRFEKKRAANVMVALFSWSRMRFNPKGRASETSLANLKGFPASDGSPRTVSYTHLRAHETP